MVAQVSSLESRLSPSQQLGKYQLVATLGQGGMGTVHLALASGLGQFRKLLVLKELRRDLTQQEGFVSMFMDEAKLAARLAHPNVVQTFEASEVGDRYFLAMEYLDGQSLSALLDRSARSSTSKLSLSMHIQILCEALSGLHYAHELLDYDSSSLNVVHRDVSPQNVFVTYYGQVKVVDFGVAKVGNACVKTAPGLFVGKFSYAAPEQVLGGPVDARTDVFAAGVMLWRAIAGRPFSDEVPTPAACRARCEGLEPRIAEVVPTVDPALARICDRALAVDPEQRFASAKEFRTALQSYLKRAGARVEASEIGQLMHEVFDEERRALHAQIERAMSRTGPSDPSVEGLSVFHHVDTEPTAVADLSSLVQVSLEHDDQKIQEGYTHSKITLVRAPTKQEPAIPMSTISQIPWRRLITVVPLCLGVLVGSLIALFQGHAPPKTVVVTRSAITARPAPAPKAVQLEVNPPPTVDEAASELIAPSPSGSAPMPRKSEGASRLRNHSAPTRLSQRSREAHEGEPERASSPEPSATQHTVEAGANLFVNRPPISVTIDRENPYR